MNKDQFIKTFCTEEEKRGDGFYIFRGFTENQSLEGKIPPEYKYVEEWSDGFRQVWISDQLHSTITYCEGDVIVTHHERKTSYLCEIENATNYYKEQ